MKKPKTTYAWGLFDKEDGELLTDYLAHSRSEARRRWHRQGVIHRVRITPLHNHNGRK